MSNLGHRVFVYLVFLSSLAMFGCGDSAASSTLTLEARLGTAVKGVNGAIGESLNKSISNLNARKDLDKGIVTIQFEFESPRWPGARFLVRLFDKNGNHLTHFATQRHAELFGGQGVMETTKKPVSLSYPVNLRDLKEAT